MSPSPPLQDRKSAGRRQPARLGSPRLNEPAAQPSPGGNHGRPSRRYRADGAGILPDWRLWLAAILLGVLAAGTVQAGGHLQPPAGYTRQSLRLDQELAAVHPFDLDGDGRLELVVLEADRASSRREHLRARVFTQDAAGIYQSGPPSPPLPTAASLSGVARFSQGAALAMLTPAGLHIWPLSGAGIPPSAAGLPPAFPTASIFSVPSAQLETRWDWLRDLDGDGKSEVILPRFDGVDILQQDGAGTWSRRAHLAGHAWATLREWTFVRRRMLSFDLPTVHPLPNPGGGWPDMIVFQGGVLRRYSLANPGGEMATALLEADFQPPRPFDPRKPLDPPLQLVHAGDINGDGLLDVLFTKTPGSDSQLRTRTTLLVYYGQAGAGGRGVVFSPANGPQPDQVFTSEGFVYPIVLDLNQDGRTDLVMVNVEIDLWNAIKAFIARTVNAEAAFYLMPAGGRFAATPDALNTYSVKFSLGRRAHQPIFAFADLNGDRLPDLLLSETQERIGIHWGNAAGIWGQSSGQGFTDLMPAREKRLLVSDLNGDGRDDLILAYDRDDVRLMPEVENSLTLLTSIREPAPVSRAALPGGGDGAGTN